MIFICPDSDRDYLWNVDAWVKLLVMRWELLNSRMDINIFDWKMLTWHFYNRRLGWHVSEILPILCSLSALFLDVSIIYAGVLILTTKFCLTIGNCVCVCVLRYSDWCYYMCGSIFSILQSIFMGCIMSYDPITDLI